MKIDRNKQNILLIESKNFAGLLSANYRYIKQCANRYNNAAYQNDLEQVGKIGLWNAYKNFDVSNGTPFMKFAGIYIKNEMALFLGNETRIIKTPIQCQRAYGKYLQIENPTEEDLKQFSKKQLEFIYSANLLKPKSLDEPVYEDSIMPLSETILSEEEPEPDERIEKLLVEIKKMKPHIQDVIIKHYGLFGCEPMAVKDIAKLYKCTASNISGKIRKAEKELSKLTQLKKA